MKITSILLFILENIGRILLFLITLSLSYCAWLLEDPYHYSRVSNDKNIGKTVLIFRSAGRFIPDSSWPSSKGAGDYSFNRERLPFITSTPPKLYKITERYHGIYHIYPFHSGEYVYRLKPDNKENSKQRLLISLDHYCEENKVIDSEQTSLNIDFICR